MDDKKSKILIVEDDPAIARDLKNTLEKNKYLVLDMCGSGEDAVQKAEQLKPDLILMDMVLKGAMDGIDAAHAIQSRFDIPILYLTASADDEMLKKAKSGEPFGFIVKSSPENEICATIEMELNRYGIRKKLFESEERYRMLFESSPDGILVVDIETKKFLFANPAFGRMMGYNEEEIKGAGVEDIHPRDSIEHVAAEMEYQITGKKKLAEKIPCIKKDGTIIYADISSAPCIIEGKKVLIGFFRDITEREESQKKLSDSEEKYRILFNLSRDAIMTISPPSWMFTAANSATIEMFGAKNEEEFINKGPWDVSPEYQSDGELSSIKAKRMIEKAMADGSNFFEWDHMRLNGEVFTATVLLSKIEMNGMQSLQATVRDVSERKKIERKFEEKQRLNTLLLDSLPHAAMLIKKDRTVVAMNRQAQEVGVIIGRKCWMEFGKNEFISDEDKDKIKKGEMPSCAQCYFCLADTALDKNIPANDPEVQAWGKIWDTYWIPLNDDLYLHYGIDVTERKKMQEQLFQSAKMASLGEMAAGIAHELNTPLNVILGYQELLKKRLKNDLTCQEYVDIAIEEVEQCSRLISDFMLYARPYDQTDTGNKRLDVGEAVRASVKLLTLHKKPDLKVLLNIDRDIPCIKGDQKQIMQVIVNLINNALQAMPEGGELSIALKHAHNIIKFIVKDTGIGIPEDQISNIFDPFFTTKRPGKGTGLGLAVCLRIMNNHKGKMYVQSVPGKGTTIIGELPVT